MTCPECGNEQAVGAAICTDCDAILDPSFLGEDLPAEMDDEGTDPGSLGSSDEAPSAEAEPGTMIFDASVLSEQNKSVSSETLNSAESAESGTFVGPSPALGGDDEAYETYEDDDETYEDDDEAYDDDDEAYDDDDEAYEEDDAPQASASAEPSAGGFNYKDYVEDPPPSPSAQQVAGGPAEEGGTRITAAPAGRKRQGPIGRPAPGAPPASPGAERAQGRISSALEFDTSSKMMDEYEDMFGQTWAGFLALAPPDKVSVVGALLAAVTVGFPWTVTISPSGMADEHMGLAGMGILGLLLAGASLASTWYRLNKNVGKQQVRKLVLGQVGLCAGGLVWSLISLASAASLTSNLLDNPYHVTPGPGYGLYIHMAAWTVAGIGAVVALKDLPAGGRRPRR